MASKALSGTNEASSGERDGELVAKKGSKYSFENSCRFIRARFHFSCVRINWKVLAQIYSRTHTRSNTIVSMHLPHYPLTAI